MGLVKHVIFLAVIFGTAYLLVGEKISSEPYGYDEADYMFAATLGPAANWLDSGTMPIVDYVREGLTRGRQKGQQDALSSMARSRNDPVFYRHERGPLYFYWLTFLSSLHLDEHGTRAASLLFPALTALALYFGSLFVLSGMEGQVAAVLSSSMFLWSPVTLKTTELAPHPMFVLFYVLTLLLLAKVVRGGDRRYFYGAVFCTGLAYSTMEIAFVLVALLAIFAYWRREEPDFDKQMALRSAGLFLATVLIVWPGSIFKFSFVKIYMVMAYLAIFRKNAWGATISETWIDRFHTSPVEWLLLLVAIGILAARWKERNREPALVFLGFALLMVIATLRLPSLGTRNTTPFWAALASFTTWMFARELSGLNRRLAAPGATVVICGLLVWNTRYQLSDFMLKRDDRMAAALTTIRASQLSDGKLLVPRQAIPALHYYFPGAALTGYADETTPASGTNDRFDAILYPNLSLKIETPPGRSSESK